jgi:WD40 repeat protein
MESCIRFLLGMMLVVCWMSPVLAQSKATGAVLPGGRLDSFGDPLPEHALLRLGTVRLIHGARVLGTFASPDGRSVKAIDADGWVRIWEVETGKELSSYQLQTDGMQEFVILSPNRAILAGTCSEGIRLWDSASGKVMQTLKDGLPPFRLMKPAFTPGGKTLIGLAATGQMVFWQVDSGKKIKEFELETPQTAKEPLGEEVGVVYSDFSQDATKLAGSGGQAKRVCIWNTADGKLLRRLPEHPEAVGEVRFSPYGKTLASGCGDGTVRLWDVETGKLLRQFKGYSEYDFAFSPDGKLIFLQDRDGEFQVFNIKNGEQWPRQFKTRGRELGRKEFGISPDGKLLIARASVGWGSTRLLFWDVGSGNLLGNGYDAPVPLPLRGAGYSHDGQSVFMSNVLASPLGRTERYSLAEGKRLETYLGAFLAVASDGKKLATLVSDYLCISDIATSKRIWKGRISEGFSPAEFTDDGTKIVFEARDRKLHVADAKTGEVLKDYKPLPYDLVSLFPVRESWVSYSPNLEYAATAEEKSTVVKVIEWKTGKTVRKIEGTPSTERYGLAFSPDGKHLLVINRERSNESIALWNIASGKQVSDLPPGTFAGFSPDGRLLCIRAEKTFVFWDIKSRRIISKMPAEEETRLAFSPDSRMVVTIGKTDVTVWEVVTGNVRRHFEGTRSQILSVAFSPDSKTLMTASDSSVLVWNLGK